MFADDFVGLQTLSNVVQGFCNKCRLKSNKKECCYGIF